MERPDLDAPASEWIVYADALQIAGDPRGELISLVHGADAAARDTYVHKHAPALLGPAAKGFRTGAYRLTWRHCLIDRAEVIVNAKRDGAAALQALLASPAARELRELAIVGDTADGAPVNLSKAITVLAALPPRCKTLAIVDERATRARTQISREYGIDENLVTFDTLAPIWKLPVEHVRIEVADCTRLDFGRIDGHALTSFALRSLRTLREQWDPENGLAQALGASNWDTIEDFELRLAETFVANIPLERTPYVATYSDDPDDEHHRYPDEAEDGDDEGVGYECLAPLFAKLARAPLRRLALTSFVSAQSLLATLRAAGLARTVRILDLSDSAFGSDGEALLAEHAPLFANLDELVLERTSLERPPSLGVKVRHSHAEDAPTYRYAVGME